MLTEEATYCGYNRASSQRSQDESMPIAMNPDSLQKEFAAQYRGLPIGATVVLVVLVTLGSASVAAFAGGPPTGPIPAPIDPATIHGLLNSQAVQAATAQPAPAPATSTPAAPAAVATPQPAPACPPRKRPTRVRRLQPCRCLRLPTHQMRRKPRRVRRIIRGNRWPSTRI